MIFLKNMERMGSIMKTKECTNCGSTQFHHVKEGWKCDYCGTLYVTPKQPRPAEIPKKKKAIFSINAAIPIIIMLVGLVGYSVVNSSKSEVSYKPIEPGNNQTAKEEFPGDWTQEIYDSVKVATQNYDADNEKYSFENGSSYEELEKLVGKPDTVTSWEKENYGMPPRSMATWNKDSNGNYMSHSVTVTYEKNTRIITDKSHY